MSRSSAGFGVCACRTGPAELSASEPQPIIRWKHSSPRRLAAPCRRPPGSDALAVDPAAASACLPDRVVHRQTKPRREIECRLMAHGLNDTDPVADAATRAREIPSTMDTGPLVTRRLRASNATATTHHRAHRRDGPTQRGARHFPLFQEQRSARSSPSTSSRTRNGFPPSYSRPCIAAMWGWLREATPCSRPPGSRATRWILQSSRLGCQTSGMAPLVAAACRDQAPDRAAGDRRRDGRSGAGASPLVPDGAG